MNISLFSRELSWSNYNCKKELTINNDCVGNDSFCQMLCLCYCKCRRSFLFTMWLLPYTICVFVCMRVFLLCTFCKNNLSYYSRIEINDFTEIILTCEKRKFLQNFSLFEQKGYCIYQLGWNINCVFAS